MIDHNHEKRLTSTKIFYGYLSDVIANFSAIRSAKSKLGAIKKLFGVLQPRKLMTKEGAKNV
ncbi:MAG: hypothetical protein ACJAWW_001705 [Sulfurimonas sp.]|jgi:hypothetical protein